MTYMRFSVSRGGTVVKRKLVSALGRIDAFLENFVLLPELYDFLFPFHKVE